MIPKIIHYCWLSNDSYPEDFKRCIDTWKEKLPDYEFILWNFERFDIKSSLWVKQAFENKKYAFAADYIRLYAIYNYGGIYMDMDIEVLKPFDDILDSPIMIAYENDEKTGIEAGCFGAEKGDELIEKCLSYYENRSFIKDDGSFDDLPLPKIIINFINKNSNLQIYTSDYFTCKSYKTGIITTTKKSYAIHHFAGSWTSTAQKRYDKQRQYLLTHFAVLGKILLIIPFCVWQISDNGIKGFLRKSVRKIRKEYLL